MCKVYNISAFIEQRFINSKRGMLDENVMPGSLQSSQKKRPLLTPSNLFINTHKQITKDKIKVT